MKKTSTILYILLTAIILFVVGCDNSPQQTTPPKGKVKVEVFSLVNGDYVEKEDETPIFDFYYVSGKNELVAVLQVKNTGSLICDYELAVSVDSLPSEIDTKNMNVYVAEFLTAPQLVSDAVKNGEFESFGSVGETALQISTGTLKVGAAAYVAIIVDLPVGCDEDADLKIARSLNVSISSEEHSTIVSEENAD